MHNVVLISAQTALETSKCSLTKGEKELANHERALRDAMDTLGKAENALPGCEHEHESIRSKKEKLELAMNDCFVPLQRGSFGDPATKKQLIASLMSLGKRFQLQASLMKAFSCVLEKEPADRNTDDNEVLEHFKSEIGVWSDKICQLFESSLKKKEENTAAVLEARKAYEKVRQQHVASETNLEESRVSHQACDAALRVAVHAFEASVSERELNVAAYDVAGKRLVKFQAGPLAVFCELKER